jgi:hypothetical protein
MRSRYLLALGVSVLLLLLHPAAGLAALANDDFDSATPVGTLPFTDTLDITQATVAGDDPLECFGGPPAGTVWYSFTPTFSGLVAPVVVPNPYLFGVPLYTGSRGSLTLEYCGSVVYNVTAGVTYHFMLASLVPDLGTITFSLDRYIPPQVSLAVNSTGLVNPKTGEATLSGTFSCSSDIGAAIGDDGAAGRLRQLFARRFFIDGFFDITPPTVCTGATTPWTATVVGSNGLFAAGKAHVLAGVTACDSNGVCADATVDKDIQLKSARR